MPSDALLFQPMACLIFSSFNIAMNATDLVSALAHQYKKCSFIPACSQGTFQNDMDERF